MLQRAASNAYSWWWASHIRAKQGKWLDQNLQDMEEKVKAILSLIEDDADSFAKRAEMFYKKRPELMNFVEEYHEAYRLLAERYCHIAKDLQNANRTIATAFPNQVQFSMDDDDDNDDEVTQKASSLNSKKIPKEFPRKLDLKFLVQSQDTDTPLPLRPEKSQAQKASPHQKNAKLSPEELDKLQKEILALQTEMESVKSSCESALAKYWEIEERIKGMQEKFCNLQDEFSISTIIEDSKARSLVAVTALRSCEDTLVQLQEQQVRSVEEVRVESQKMKDIEQKFKVLKNELLQNQTENQVSGEVRLGDSTAKTAEEEVCSPKQEKLEFQLICEKVKEYFEMNYDSPLTVTDLAEKIDELVNVILDLQTTASSQNALIKRLRLDSDELQNHLLGLEQDKANLISGSNALNEKIRELENELRALQNLNHSVKDQNKQLQMGFAEVCHELNDLSEKLQSGEKQDDVENIGAGESDYTDDSTEECEEQEMMMILANNSKDLKDEMMESEQETKGLKDHDLCVEDQENRIQPKPHVRVKSRMLSNLDLLADCLQDLKNENEVENRLPSQGEDGALVDTMPKPKPHVRVKLRTQSNLDAFFDCLQGPKNQDAAEKILPSQAEDSAPLDVVNSPNWKQLLSKGSEEDKKRIVLEEYTSILRNYKETKRKLFEAEQENKDTFFETMTLVKQLKSINALKEMEIRSLRQKLCVLDTNPDENLHHGGGGSVKDVSKFGTDNLQEKSLCGSNSNSLENLVKENSNDSSERTDESNAIVSAKTHTKEETDSTLAAEPHVPSTIKEKFRKDIDELLEENLQFWLRFSTSSQQIQKIQTETKDLQAQCSRVSSSSSDSSSKAEAAPIIKRLNELQAELSEWLEENASLEVELQCRNSSLCKIQEEISQASKMCYENKQVEFTAYEATKLQGEVLNMQQENNKIESDLQTGLDHVRGLQLEVEKAVSMLQGNSQGSGSKGLQATCQNTVSLESFIYGKPKKHSKFSFMNPTLQKQFRDLKAQLPK